MAPLRLGWWYKGIPRGGRRPIEEQGALGAAWAWGTGGYAACATPVVWPLESLPRQPRHWASSRLVGAMSESGANAATPHQGPVLHCGARLPGGWQCLSVWPRGKLCSLSSSAGWKPSQLADELFLGGKWPSAFGVTPKLVTGGVSTQGGWPTQALSVW